jgi:hypothetical protein
MDRGATPVRTKALFSLFEYEYIRIPYPFNGGIPCIPTDVQDTSRKSIPTLNLYRFTAPPAL